MKIEEKISVIFTNTIRHAQRHRLTAGDILSRTRRNERLRRLRKQIQAEKDKNREAKELPEQQLETGKNWKTSFEVKPPVVMPVENPKDHMRNAFLEFAALTIAIQDVTKQCVKHSEHIQERGHRTAKTKTRGKRRHHIQQ
ncbi:hypothetical protein EVAR_52375_1 [Eumeta japonica]|uniref:Uncharacterized protein n=1 Tax=Eumeta variegata TaxID=151549 RepID=A0A4C1YT06_EUMVA|nr:hypothetical protein EVAR_52375_1 [Eumeta japonica]